VKECNARGVNDSAEKNDKFNQSFSFHMIF